MIMEELKKEYTFNELVNKANELGFNKDGKSMFFLSDNFYENIFKPVLIFDVKKEEWNFNLMSND